MHLTPTSYIAGQLHYHEPEAAINHVYLQIAFIPPNRTLVIGQLHDIPQLWDELGRRVSAKSHATTPYKVTPLRANEDSAHPVTSDKHAAIRVAMTELITHTDADTNPYRSVCHQTSHHPSMYFYEK